MKDSNIVGCKLCKTWLPTKDSYTWGVVQAWTDEVALTFNGQDMPYLMRADRFDVLQELLLKVTCPPTPLPYSSLLYCLQPPRWEL